MANDWELRGTWIEAQVSRSFVQGSGSAVHAWARWSDGTYGSFQGRSGRDVTGRFPVGSSVPVLVDPAQRLRRYRMALDGEALGPIDYGLAEPADEPALAGKLIETFSGGTGSRALPSECPTASRVPRAAGSSWAPLVVGCVMIAGGAYVLRLVAGGSDPVLYVVPGAAAGIGLVLVLAVMRGALAQARLRRTGLRVPATVFRSRQVLVQGGRSARFRWEVMARATVEGQARELVSEHLCDDKEGAAAGHGPDGAGGSPRPRPLSPTAGSRLQAAGPPMTRASPTSRTIPVAVPATVRFGSPPSLLDRDGTVEYRPATSALEGPRWPVPEVP